jgi:hypothetical protein
MACWHHGTVLGSKETCLPHQGMSAALQVRVVRGNGALPENVCVEGHLGGHLKHQYITSMQEL